MGNAPERGDYRADCSACGARLNDGDEAMMVPYRTIDVRGTKVTWRDAERLMCLRCPDA